ncbi:MAG: AgmX/PglI C-terminal domain-containing protein [Myxococcota bacterium]|nr:AgmX/PglI C-terminal domain-containing protein [Myxococcota bacterium]
MPKMLPFAFARRAAERAVAPAVVLAVALAVPLWACGGEPPPKAVEPPPAPPPVPRGPALQMKSELGSVDPSAVKQAFSKLEDKFVECQKRGLERVEVLAGNVKFFVRIGEDGGARWAFLEESELGDRDTEKCLQDVVIAARWPKPQGGEAEARYTMELPLQATRAPNEWSSDKVTGALGRHSEALDRCKVGAHAKFRATMYVGPGGKVLAAGIATTSKEDNEKADCLAKVLQKMRGLPSPGSWPAKVSFAL